MYLHLEVLAGTHGYLKDGGPSGLPPYSCSASGPAHSTAGQEGNPGEPARLVREVGAGSHLGTSQAAMKLHVFSTSPTGLP